MKKFISFILAAAMTLTICPALMATAADDVITIQAEDYTSLEQNGSIYEPIVETDTVQFYEKSYVTFSVDATEAITYELNAKLGASERYVADSTMKVNVYVGEEKVISDKLIAGTDNDGDGMTDLADFNLGFVTLSEGTNIVKIEIPDGGAARSIILDYIEMKKAMTVVDGQHIEAEGFNMFYRPTTASSSSSAVTGWTNIATPDELNSNEKLTNGTNADSTVETNAILFTKGTHASYNISVAETGYYNINLRYSVQGMTIAEATASRLPASFSFCDDRLVPTFTVNGVASYNAKECYGKKVNTLSASPLADGETRRPGNTFGPYISDFNTTIYLNKGGNNILVGFEDKLTTLEAHNNQPFQLDYFTLSYKGPEKTDDDKPNIQVLSDTEPTTFATSLYDYEVSACARNDNFLEASKVVIRMNDKLYYNVRSEFGGSYKVSGEVSFATVGDGIELSYSVNNGGSTKTQVVADTVITDGYATKRFGVVDLEPGVNTILFEASDGMYFKSLIFEDAAGEVADPIWAPIKIAAENVTDFFVNTQFDIDNTNSGLDRTGWVDTPELLQTGGVVCRRGDFLEYTFDVPVAGNYDLSFNLSEADRPKVPIYYIINDGKEQVMDILQTLPAHDWNIYETRSICQTQLPAGTNKIKIGIKDVSANYGWFLRYFQVSNIDVFESIGARANYRDIDGGVDVFRGTDTLKVYFSGLVDEATVNETSVKLTDSNGNTVKTDTSIKDNIINVLLMETLEYGETYTLTLLSSVASVHEMGMAGNVTYTFTVADEGGVDQGSDTIDTMSADILYEDVTIEGTVKSSNGLVMEGREIIATVTDPNSDYVGETRGLSNESGIFTLDFEIPSGSQEGIYTVVVTDEYGAPAVTDTVIYFAEQTETEFLDALNGATDSDGVETVLTTFESRLGYDLATDLAEVIDADGFYAHFVDVEYEKISDFLDGYDLFIAVERVRQCDDVNDVEDQLYTEEVAKQFGIALSNIQGIGATNSQYKASFLDEVRRNRTELNAYQYVEDIQAIVDKYIGNEYSKSAPAIATTNYSVQVGRGITLNAAYTQEQTLVGNAKIVFTGAILDGATVTPAEGVSALTETGKVTFTLDSATPVTITSLGTIAISTAATGVNIVGVSGNINYLVADGVNVAYDVANANIVVAVTSTQTGEDLDVPGGGAQTGGAPRPTAKPTVKPTVEPTEAPTQTPGEYKFNDLAGNEWAEEYIYRLLNSGYGIISESPDNEFRPSDAVTREEFVKMLVLAKGVYNTNAVCDLADLDRDKWYYSYVASAVEAGYVKGDQNGNFGVGQYISRQDMTVMLARAFGDILPEADTTNEFADDSSIADYAKDSVYRVKQAGIVNGVGDNMFDPNGTATRAMAAKVICMALDLM